MARAPGADLQSDDVNRIAADVRVPSEHGEFLDHGLRDQQPVKGIPVNVREPSDAKRMPQVYRERQEVILGDLSWDELLGVIG